MSRKILLLMAALAVFAVSGLGQSTTQSTPYNGPFGGPILMTPNASFSNPPPAAGISDAGRAGISANPSGTASGEAVPMTTVTTTTVKNRFLLRLKHPRQLPQKMRRRMD